MPNEELQKVLVRMNEVSTLVRSVQMELRGLKFSLSHFDRAAVVERELFNASKSLKEAFSALRDIFKE